MIGRATCADLAELRSAYVDGSLRPADRERIAVHLAGCARCRAEVEDLRRVRNMLAQPRAEVAAADLAARLMAIAEQTPRRRQPRPGLRRAGVAALLVGVTAVGVAGVGYAAAPVSAAAQLPDPTAQAAEAYQAALVELPLAPAAVAAVAAVAPRRGPDRIEPRSDADLGRALTPAELRGVLERALGAEDATSFRGRQSFEGLDGGSVVTATVDVVNRAGQGADLVTRDADGTQVSRTVRAARPQTRMSDSDSLDLLATSYALSGRAGATVAGRAAVLVEARSADTTAARWWIDRATGLVLWQEKYDPDGTLRQSTGFTWLTVGRIPPLAVQVTDARRTEASLTLTMAPGLAANGWACEDRLADYSLVRLRSDASPDPAVVQMVYSDGVSAASVLAQRGTLADTPQRSAWDAALGAYVTDGAAPTATWESGDTVYTVVADDHAPLAAVVAALPHAREDAASTMDRVRAGWSRILGSG